MCQVREENLELGQRVQLLPQIGAMIVAVRGAHPKALAASGRYVSLGAAEGMVGGNTRLCS